ncbi:MAG TPA: alpha-amylase family glycosyl hydrolase, partial [Burkholderiales bacterium]|nr:alpha-amylase family glycosyl hydrolase [Burkholderiales bacterium]
RVAARCDGVRCDMAMLVLPDVFERTWGRRGKAFWPRVTRDVRRAHPGFAFMAEVYWDLEWTLQRQGFDFTYDKRLYDRLREGGAQTVRDHLRAGLDYQSRLARFLENHDEPRAASAFPDGAHEAAAILTFLTPGLRFFYQGELEGRTRRVSPHLVRAPQEPVNAKLSRFYLRLLDILKHPALRSGIWQLLDCVPAWEGSDSAAGFIAWIWHGTDGERVLTAVNFSARRGQCFVRLPFVEPEAGHCRLTDLLGPAQYERAAADLSARGLYLDVPAWHCHVFNVSRVGQSQGAH